MMLIQKLRYIPISFLLLLIVNAGCSEITSPGDTIAPDTPQNFVLLGGGDGQARFRWEGNSEINFKEYRLYRAVSLDSFELLVSLTQREYVDRFLDYDVTYYYYLTAYDNAGNESSPTNTIDVQPLNISAPQPPSRVIASGFNNPEMGVSQIQVTWLPPNIGDLKNYFIYRGEDSLFIPDKNNFIDSTNIALYVDNITLKNVKYYYKIIAQDKGSKLSLPSKFSGDLILPSPVLISPANNTRFGNPKTFLWQDVEGAVKYEMFVGSGPFTDILWTSQPTNKSEMNYSGPTLRSDKVYYWWVGAYSRNEITLEDGSKVSSTINSYSLISSFFVE